MRPKLIHDYPMAVNEYDTVKSRIRDILDREYRSKNKKEKQDD